MDELSYDELNLVAGGDSEHIFGTFGNNPREGTVVFLTPFQEPLKGIE